MGMTRKQYLDRLDEFEGVVKHMYLDSNGFVTVGRGVLIDPIKLIKTKGIVFKHRGSNKIASQKEIAEDYKKVKKIGKGFSAGKYKAYTKLDATNTSLQASFANSLKQAEKDAKIFYPDLDKLPDEVRYALIDMAYNLGLSKLRKYKKLKKALEAGDYEKAAKESNRRGIQIKRNQAIYNWIASGKK